MGLLLIYFLSMPLDLSKQKTCVICSLMQTIIKKLDWNKKEKTQIAPLGDANFSI